MREVLALTTFVLLVWIGWNQSYGDHFSSVLGGKPVGRRVPVKQAVTPEVAAAVAAPVRDNSWMWEKSKLDNPRDGSTRHAR